MAKAILISIITFIISIFVEANVGARWNMPGIGCILAVVIMGGAILNAIENKKIVCKLTSNLSNRFSYVKHCCAIVKSALL